VKNFVLEEAEKKGKGGRTEGVNERKKVPDSIAG